MICTPNNYSTIRDISFQALGCMQNKMEQFRPQTHITGSIRYTILCIHTHLSWKVQAVLDVKKISQIWSCENYKNKAGMKIQDDYFTTEKMW